MKMKTIIFVTILIILTAIFVNYSSKEKGKEEFKPLELNVGDIFDKVEFSDTMYVLNYGIEDVTGDSKKDMILVVGNKENVDVPFAKKVDAVVFDTEKQTFQKANLKYYEGQNPRISFADYTGDGINEILLQLDYEDGTKNIRIVEVTGESMKEIFNRRDNRGVVFVGEMIDGIKAHLRCGKFSEEMYVDLSDMKTLLLENGKINDSGKMIAAEKTVTTTAFFSVENITLNNQSGLQTTQRIVAFPEKLILDEIKTIWKYENGKWQVVETKGNRVHI